MSRDRIVLGATETTCTTRTHHGTKLQDILMSDKPNLSYADFHDELTKNLDAPLPKCVGSQQSPVLERKNLKEEELVRYMSNLPSYLEKGMNSQERALNVGVLDWRRLEKWQYSQNQMPPKHSVYSPSSSNASLFSTDGSSTHSSRGQSRSPARQRLQRISMQSEGEASLKGCHVQDAKSSSGRIPHEIEVFRGNTDKFRDSASVAGNRSSRQHKSFDAAPLCERKGSDLQSFSQTGRKSIPDKYEVAATWKGKNKIQYVDPTKEIERLREIKMNATDRGSAEIDKPGIDIMPGDPLEHTCSSLTSTTRFTMNNRLSVDPGEKILLNRNNLVDRVPSRMLSSPPRSRHRQESKPVAEIRRNTVAMASEKLNATENSESIPKARNPSPIRRLSNAMGKMIKNVGSRENSPLRRSSSKDCIPKCVSDAADSSLYIDNPCSDNFPVNSSRGRSSPLRRFLDPLLKPRASICSEPSIKLTSSGVDTFRSRRHSIDVNSRPGCASEAHNSLKNGSSTFQALLQVSFKNGFPLFTFAIDNEKNILAATVRKSSAPGKGQHRWIYTFFAIHEVKKKSGNWLNQGGKGVNHGIVPNVVAQMKVTDSCSIKHENGYDAVSREFDLFAVDMGHGDEYSTDFHPTNELAAIIINLPRINNESISKDDIASYDWLDISQGSLRENSQVIRSNDNSGGNTEFHHSFPGLNLITTVILPGGVHTVPSKGEISRLAQRWRSGGLCDCGGWDLGCRLRVYANKKEYKSKLDSSGICQKDRLQLFSLVGQDNQPVLSMTPFKERVYSVEFSSSISLLQAFAVSVSFIDCRRPPDLPEPSNEPEKVTAEVGVFEMPIRPKMSNQAEVPGRYVSYPPHSPVGRV